MAAVLGLIIGVVIGVFVRPDIPIELQPYLPIMVLAAFGCVARRRTRVFPTQLFR